MNKTQKNSGGLWLAALVLLVFAAGASAQTFSIDWFKIAGGGGTSTGGVYSMSGTIGQPDAGTMSGGPYSLAGGFWSGIGLVQTPGAPLLRAVRTSTNTVMIAWLAPSTDFDLEQNSHFGTTNWSRVATPPMTIGGEKQVVVPASVGNQFYRLRKP